MVFVMTDRTIRAGALKKQKLLIERLKGLGSLLIAFSGGIDSTLLLLLAHRILGENILAVTAQSPIHPKWETRRAVRFVKKNRIPYSLIPGEELRSRSFTVNRQNRCYHCKRQLFLKLRSLAKQKDIPYIAHGANADDTADYRPGLLAAREFGVIAPLVDVGMAKPEIRLLAEEMAVPYWDSPAESCLATRIPYGYPITEEKLRSVEAAEAFLAEQGFGRCRVRHHENTARIELANPAPEKLFSPDLRDRIVERFRALGFEHVALDLEGYISGKMNRGLEKNG